MTNDADSLIVAFATVDGIAVPRVRFGEAKQYEIYRITADDAMRLESVANPKAGEGHGARSHHHASGGGKAAGIGRLLAQHGVQVMVSRAFGQNIVRMRERFLPVKVDTEEVAPAIGLLRSHWSQVQSRWLLGQARKHLVLRSHPLAVVGFSRDMAQPPGSACATVLAATFTGLYMTEELRRHGSYRHRYAVDRISGAGAGCLRRQMSVARTCLQRVARRV